MCVCVSLGLSKIQHLYYNLIKIISKMVLLVLQSGKEGQKNPKIHVTSFMNDHLPHPNDLSRIHVAVGEVQLL